MLTGMKDNQNVTWGKIYYSSSDLKYEGFMKLSFNSKDLVPSGQGISYFENGKINMEGNFGNDWFIEIGKEYYNNGNIRFIGEYNKGPRNYYGPRYFVFGRLFDELGNLWYEGTFHFRKSGIGYPRFEKDKSFKDGIEFNSDGSIKQKYVDGTVEIIYDDIKP